MAFKNASRSCHLLLAQSVKLIAFKNARHSCHLLDGGDIPRSGMSIKNAQHSCHLLLGSVRAGALRGRSPRSGGSGKAAGFEARGRLPPSKINRNFYENKFAVLNMEYAPTAITAFFIVSWQRYDAYTTYQNHSHRCFGPDRFLYSRVWFNTPELVRLK